MATEIQRRQVNMLVRAAVLDNGNRSVRKFCIGPISQLHRLRNAEIIPGNTVIPVFLQIGGEGLRSEVHVGRIGTQKCELADVCKALGKGDRLQCGAVIECISSQVRHTLRDMDLP